MNVFSGGEGGNHFHSLRFGSGDFQKSLPDLLMKGYSFGFNAVMLSGSFRAFNSALETFLRRQVQ